MSSSDDSAKRILRNLGVESVQEQTPRETTCPYDCSSEFQTLDNLNEYVQQQDSDIMTLEMKNKAQGDQITRLDFLCRNLRYEQERFKQEIKETARIHSERLDNIDKRQEDSRLLISENVAKIAKLEEHTNDISARLDDERRQRKDSDLRIWGFFGFLGLLWLLNTQRPVETQTQTESSRASPAVTAAEEYVRTKAYFRSGGINRRL